MSKVTAVEFKTPVYKSALLEFPTKGAVDIDAPIRFVASTETVDRYGDIIRASGWQLENYKKNPVVLFGHSHADIVGRSPSVWVEGKRLMSEISLAAAGTSALVDSVRSLVAQRILKAVSVGFMPIEHKLIRDDENDHITGVEFEKQDLLEISLVAVPANQEALQVARSLNISRSLQRTLFVPATTGYSTLRARIDLMRLR